VLLSKHVVKFEYVIRTSCTHEAITKSLKVLNQAEYIAMYSLNYLMLYFPVT